MVKVKATDKSIATGRRIKELGKIATPGEIFYVTETRFNYLNGNNPLRTVFVIKVDEEEKKNDHVEVPEIIIFEPETVTVFDDIKNQEEISKNTKKSQQKKKKNSRKKAIVEEVKED